MLLYTQYNRHTVLCQFWWISYTKLCSDFKWDTELYRIPSFKKKNTILIFII